MTPSLAPPQALPQEVLREIAARGGVKRYPAHAVLITEGDMAGARCSSSSSGTVKVYAANEAGKEMILNTHGPGEYVGEMAMDGGSAAPR